jgi:hypothetical protein
LSFGRLTRAASADRPSWMLLAHRVDIGMPAFAPLLKAKRT